MGQDYSFGFMNNDLNRQLIARLKRAGIRHHVSKEGAVHYSPADEEAVDDCVSSIRDKVFASWQILTCPRDWTARYKKYMSRNGIPFYEELSNGELWFLLPRKYRPHRWKLDSATT